MLGAYLSRVLPVATWLTFQRNNIITTILNSERATLLREILPDWELGRNLS